MGGRDFREGRVEVFRSRAWGTVCDNGWDLADAKVACREVGSRDADEALGGAAFPGGFGLPVLLDDLSCRGDEESLFMCQHNGLAQDNCSHHNDAGVRCHLAGRTLWAKHDNPTLSWFISWHVCTCQGLVFYP